METQPKRRRQPPSAGKQLLFLFSPIDLLAAWKGRFTPFLWRGTRNSAKGFAQELITYSTASKMLRKRHRDRPLCSESPSGICSRVLPVAVSAPTSEPAPAAAASRLQGPRLTAEQVPLLRQSL